MSKQIEVTMEDDFTGEQVTRVICASNFTIGRNGDGFGSLEYQRSRLVEWIKDRANKQHDTSLTLLSWAVI